MSTQNKDIFGILSAIEHNYGVFTYYQRFMQLLGTINSIKKYAPNSDMCLIDCSETPISDTILPIIKHNVSDITLMHSHPLVKYGGDPSDTNRTLRKTLGEIIGMRAYLTKIKFSGKTYRRVFKLSGRYTLTTNFANINYDEMKDKVVIAKKQIWYGDPSRYIRLWSFDFNQLDIMISVFDRIYYETLTSMNSIGTCRIIEYSLTKIFDEMNIPLYESSVGVSGYYGQDGVSVND